jgi:hypothetical protein
MRDEPEGGAKAQPLKQQSAKRARRKQSTSRLDVTVSAAPRTPARPSVGRRAGGRWSTTSRPAVRHRSSNG